MSRVRSKVRWERVTDAYVDFATPCPFAPVIVVLLKDINNIYPLVLSVVRYQAGYCWQQKASYLKIAVSLACTSFCSFIYVEKKT